MSKYLLYDKLHYPKLFNEEEIPPDAIESFWISGFLDRAARDGLKIRRQEEARSIKEKMDAETASLSTENENKKQSPENKTIKTGHSFSILESQESIDTIDKKPKPKPYSKRLLEMIEPYMQHEAEIRQKKVMIDDDLSLNFVSTELEKYFEFERIEHIAATKIQKAYRGSRGLQKWKDAIKAMKAAQRIQRVARGMMTRIWVARWFFLRNTCVGRLQSHVRKILSNKHIRPKLAREQLEAIKIQRIIRGKLGRIRFRNIKLHVAATVIQVAWRGVVGRTKADRKWLDRVVIPIQTCFRRMSAVKQCKLARGNINIAAATIQKRFRIYVSNKKVTQKLKDREMEYLFENIQVLTAEESYAEEKLERLRKRFFNTGLKEKAEYKLQKLYEKMEEIHKLENDYAEMVRQREILSPRALVQGWIQELEATIYRLRLETTKAKLDCLFNEQCELEQSDAYIEEKLLEIEEFAAIKDRCAYSRNVEYADQRRRAYWESIKNIRDDHRRKVAEEKRKWTVRYYTSDGKPDKKRCPGKPWDPSILAGPEKAVYSGGHDVDLLSQTKSGDKFRIGSKESVDKVVRDMTLQTYLEGVTHYESLLNPLMKVMQNSFCPPPEMTPPEELGYGPVGKYLGPALQVIGAPPPKWDRPLSPGGTTYATDYETIETPQEKRARERVERIRQARLESEKKKLGLGSKKDKNKYEIAKYPGVDDNSLLTGDNDSWMNTSSTSVKTNKSNVKLDAIDYEVKALIRQELEQDRVKHLMKRKQRKNAIKRVSPVIPWSLLDALQGEKARFEHDKAEAEFYHKF